MKSIQKLILSVLCLGCLCSCAPAETPASSSQPEISQAPAETEETFQQSTASPSAKAEQIDLQSTAVAAEDSFSLSQVPAYSNSPSVEIHDNIPYFTKEELDEAVTSFKSFSDLDALGRCGPAVESVGVDLMPDEPRGSIGMVKPSGWHTIRYDDLIEDKYLYNRTHLLGYALSSENANELNLITGTRYMNVMGMLPYESRIADYVKETGNHVLYRVTPVFEGDNLVASGVLMEAESVEDDGAGVEFCVYCYNVQPGIVIDYATGDSQRAPAAETALPETSETSAAYIGNRNSHKFHYPWCTGVSSMAEHNKVFFDTRDAAVEAGYEPCHICNP